MPSTIEYTPDNYIKQTERLLTIRPRNGIVNIAPEAGQPDKGGNRGDRARIRLLSPDPAKTQERLMFKERMSSVATAEDLAKKFLSTDDKYGYNDFLLTDVSVKCDEKVQITQVFGDTEAVYYFGKAPIIFNLSGMLFDDLDNQWFTKFFDAYSSIMRGTKLAANYELLEITLPNMIIVGSVMSFGYSQNASRDTDIQFSMSVLAKEVRAIPVQVPKAPLSNKANVIDFGKASAFTGRPEINSVKEKLSEGYDQIKGKLPVPDQDESFGGYGSMSTQMSAADYDDEEAGIAAATNAATGNTLFKDFAAEGLKKAKAQSALLQTGIPTPPSVTSAVGMFGGSGSDTIGAIASGMGKVSSTLNSFRASLFSPIYGVLTEITRVIKERTGNISGIISSFTDPVNTILRDIKGIATVAVGVVTMVNNAFNKVSSVLQTLRNIRDTITMLRNTIGVIARVPETIIASFKRLAHVGILNGGAAFLNAHGSNKAALLNSGRPYTPSAGASL
jgi:hypothetical protein